MGKSRNNSKIPNLSRVKATGAVTLYVAPTGNDSNDGLTAGTPYLTIQKAYNTFASKYDMSGFAATIQLADGTYTTGLAATSPVASAGSLTILGNVGSPGNVVISTTSTPCINNSAGLSISISSFQMQSTSSNCILSNGRSTVTGTGTLIFGTSGLAHISSAGNSGIVLASNYIISGGAPYHVYASQASLISITGRTVTITGTPAFSAAFASGDSAGNLQLAGNTFSGSATGVRYTATQNVLINTNGGGATYLPGNSAGSVATQGQYI